MRLISCYSRRLRSRLVSTGTNAGAAAAAGGNDYTSPLRLRPIQNPRSGCFRGPGPLFGKLAGQPAGLPQGHL